MPGDDESKLDISSVLSNFGDKLVTSLAEANTRTDSLLDQQHAAYKDLQEENGKRTDKLLAALKGLPSSPKAVASVRRKDTEPPTLQEVDPIKWTSFKKCFKTTAELNNWDDKYSVKRLSTCIRDQAARAIDHLSFSSYDTLAEAFTAIEKVYLNPAGIEFFKATFKLSNREPHESFLQWHTRCRELFVRAYPSITDIEVSDDLKERFIMGLRDRNLAAQIKISDNYDSWKYTDLLNRAQKIYGNTLIVHSSYSNKPLPSDGINCLELSSLQLSPGQEPSAIQSIDKRGGADWIRSARCHYCGKVGHLANRCFAKQRGEPRTGPKSSLPAGKNNGNAAPILKRDPEDRYYYSGKSRGNTPNKSNSRGQPSRFRGKGKFHRSNRPRINAVEQSEENIENSSDYDELYDDLQDSVSASATGN